MTQAASPTEGRLVRAARFFGDNQSRLAAGVTGIGGALSAFGYEHTETFWVGISLTGLGVVWSFVSARDDAIRARKLRALEESKNKRDAALSGILKKSLTLIMDDLSDGTSSDRKVEFSEARISLYRHEEGELVCMARVSRSLSLEAPGRPKYPASQGLIGQAWDKGLAVSKRLPAKRSDWESDTKSQHLDRSTLEGIAMQSRSLVGLRVDSSTSNRDPLGVIVLESLKPQGVTGGHLEYVRDSDSYALTRAIFEECLSNIPVEEAQHFVVGVGRP